MPLAARTLWSVALAALLGACAHDRVVLTAAEGPAPARVERPALLRAHLRARARARRSAPRTPPQLLPSGMPDIQREHPEWTAPDHAPELPSIIKRHGDHLVLLHGSRLLVIATRDLRIVATHDLGHAWRAGLLVHGDHLIVRHTDPTRRHFHVKIRRFTIAADGTLTPQQTLHLRSAFGYFDDETRLDGDALVLHLQSSIGARTPDLLGLPAIRRRRAWRPLVRAADLQRPVVAAGAVHLRIRCPITGTDCTATGIVAPPAVFITSDSDAFHVWTRREVLRLPFADDPATVVRVPGQPLDLLAWRLRDHDLDAVVRTDAGLALLRLPAALLRAGLATAGPQHIRPLPLITETTDIPDIPVRFLGDRLLQADAPDWACRGPARLRIHDLTNATATDLELPHCISRIEPTGDHALLIDDRDDATRTVRLTALDLATRTTGDSRTYTDVTPGLLRAGGPYPLADAVALPAQPGAPLRVLRQDGPRIGERAADVGPGDDEHAFAADGRIYLVRDDHLLELAEDTLAVRRRLALGKR